MQLYLEKEFIDEFIHLDLKNELVVDFYDELINQSAGYHLYTNFTKQEWNKEREHHPIVRSIENGTVEVSFNKSKEDFFNNEETIHKLLLVRNNHEKKQEGNQFECISSNNLMEKWKRYSHRRRFLEVPTTINNSFPNNERFSKWKDLKRFCQHPLNEIIIYDKYILKDNYFQSIKNNLLPMLEQFKKMSSQSLKIKIITLPDQIIQNQNLDLRKKCKKIKDRITERIKECEIEILILNDQNQHKQHDRWIYTNLFFIYRGAGFNIFGPKGIGEETSEISFKFIFLRKFNSLFRVRRKIIDEIINSSEIIDTKDGNLETYTS